MYIASSLFVFCQFLTLSMGGALSVVVVVVLTQYVAVNLFGLFSVVTTTPSL